MDKKSEIILRELEEGYDKAAHIYVEEKPYWRWSDFDFLKRKAKKNIRILDYGCGAGDFSRHLKGIYREYHGLDISQNFIERAKQKHSSPKVFFLKINSGDRHLPFPDNFFDLVLAVGVFHHFPSPRYRHERVQELNRVLKENGLLVVSVFNFWRFKHLPFIISENWKKISRRNWFGFKEYFYPFKDQFNRYFHAYTQNELGALFERAGFSTVGFKTIKNNLLYLGRKTSPDRFQKIGSEVRSKRILAAWIIITILFILAFSVQLYVWLQFLRKV